MARADKPPPGPLQRAAYRVVDWSVGLLVVVFRWLPTSWVLRLGAGLGDIAYALDRRRRERTLRNLRRALGDEIAEGDRQEIAREVFRNLGRVLMEYALLMGVRDPKELAPLIEAENLALAQQVLREYPAALFVTCHGGNFDVMGAWASTRVVRLSAVVKDLRNPYLNARLLRMRESLGIGVIHKFPALRSVAEELRSGNSVALLADQRRRKRALIVEFFGKPAGTVDTPAVLALRFGVPIVPAFSYRVGGQMRFRAYVEPPIFPDKSAPRAQEVVRMTQAVNDAIERFVRAHPEQWNWSQPRWMIGEKLRRRAKNRPGDARPARR